MSKPVKIDWKKVWKAYGRRWDRRHKNGARSQGWSQNKHLLFIVRFQEDVEIIVNRQLLAKANHAVLPMKVLSPPEKIGAKKGKKR